MRTHAIILAGGDGNRFGGELPKQFIRLAGDPILVRSLRAIVAAGVDQVAIVSHPDWLSETRRLVDEAGTGVPVRVVRGGATRNESTRNGLRILEAADEDVVIVHDAVRPLVSPEVILRAIAPIVSGDADATDTVIPSADTLVIVEGDDVIEIPDRGRYRRGQTPQAFRKAVLAAAYGEAARTRDLGATDDCSLVLRHVPNARIVAVDGDEVNLKITTRIDLVLADRMLQLRTIGPSAEPQPARTLEGARLLVVGGTNGIGRAIVEEAERRGATAIAEGSSTGFDVRDYATVERCIGAAVERLGGLDHVVCTAGVLRIGAVAETRPEDLAEVVEVNLTGTLNVARASHSHLARSKGSLTVFASSSFTRGRPSYVAYSASKAGVVNLAQGLAEEWDDDGIRVNAVSPERTDTPMRRKAFPDESPVGLLTMEEVAQATLALIQSDLTCQVLDVRRDDGLGRTPDGTSPDGPGRRVPRDKVGQAGRGSGASRPSRRLRPRPRPQEVAPSGRRGQDVPRGRRPGRRDQPSNPR
jgi:ribitol-5-phosphate 2-dehydrogenase (NADP+) / D-ribitol-5-phosphate cytidylyltransferase